MTCGICYNILFDHPNHFPLDWTTFENDSKSEMLQEKRRETTKFLQASRTSFLYEFMTSSKQGIYKLERILTFLTILFKVPNLKVETKTLFFLTKLFGSK